MYIRRTLPRRVMLYARHPVALPDMAARTTSHLLGYQLVELAVWR